ncbi:MAG: hypothetical protein KKB82_06755 [Candidatus Omnitrophica bacterium]|nr:hypothetical protein [Candidatus Omnitrophota bacterium]MBU1925602.1 hypothetical protein [Candidatus Omnitrophota bacterium]
MKNETEYSCKNDLMRCSSVNSNEKYFNAKNQIWFSQNEIDHKILLQKCPAILLGSQILEFFPASGIDPKKNTTESYLNIYSRPGHVCAAADLFACAAFFADNRIKIGGIKK